MERVTWGREDETSVAGVSTMLTRMTLVGAWALVLAYAVTTGAVVAHPWLLGPFAAGLVPAVLLTRPMERLGRLESLGAAACTVAMGCTILAYDTVSAELWPYTFAAFLCAVHLARGNLAAGGASTVAVWLLGAGWAASVGADARGYTAVLALPVVVPVLFLGLNLALRRFVAQGRGHRSEETRARVSEVASAAAMELSRRELTQVRAESDPLLRRLRDGDTIDGAFRGEAALAEATIRDRIRSPRLSDATLVAAVRRLRTAGTTVLLLGEADVGHTEGLGAPLVGALTAQLEGVAPGSSVTIRTPPRASAAAVTLTVVDRSGTRRLDFAADGRMLARR